MDADLRNTVLAYLRKHRNQFIDCFTLSVELGTDCHQTALVIADIEREYVLDREVRQIAFTREARQPNPTYESESRYNKSQQSETYHQPVNFYRFGKGLTFHDTARQGDNRPHYWRTILRTK